MYFWTKFKCQWILRSVTFIPSSYPTCVWNFERNVRKRRPAKILLHLCGNFLETYFVFVTGISSTGKPDLHTAVTADMGQIPVHCRIQAHPIPMNKTRHFPNFMSFCQSAKYISSQVPANKQTTCVYWKKQAFSRKASYNITRDCDSFLIFQCRAKFLTTAKFFAYSCMSIIALLRVKE